MFEFRVCAAVLCASAFPCRLRAAWESCCPRAGRRSTDRCPARSFANPPRACRDPPYPASWVWPRARRQNRVRAGPRPLRWPFPLARRGRRHHRDRHEREIGLTEGRARGGGLRDVPQSQSPRGCCTHLGLCLGLGLGLRLHWTWTAEAPASPARQNTTALPSHLRRRFMTILLDTGSCFLRRGSRRLFLLRDRSPLRSFQAIPFIRPAGKQSLAATIIVAPTLTYVKCGILPI